MWYLGLQHTRTTATAVRHYHRFATSRVSVVAHNSQYVTCVRPITTYYIVCIPIMIKYNMLDTSNIMYLCHRYILNIDCLFLSLS